MEKKAITTNVCIYICRLSLYTNKRCFDNKKRAVYVIIGVDVNGYKDILGLWIDKTESTNFWSNVLKI